jgi:NAD(P)H dehydrogenase (quinone)
MKNILITGINGLQGKAVAEEVAKRNYNIHVLATKLPIPDAAQFCTAVEGNFNNVASLVNALQDKEYIYFALPALFDRTILISYIKNFITAALKTKPRLIVFNTGIFVPQQPTGVLAFDIKLEAEHLLRQSGLPVIYLRPRVYLDNLTAPWSIASIVNRGIVTYPIPIDQPVSWISLYDLARYTAAAFERPELAGSTFEIGAHPITGVEIARDLTSLLNREVKYLPLSVTDFEVGLRSFFSERIAREIANIYSYSANNREDILIRSSTATSLLNVQPLTFKQWCAGVSWNFLSDAQATVIRGE